MVRQALKVQQRQRETQGENEGEKQTIWNNVYAVKKQTMLGRPEQQYSH